MLIPQLLVIHKRNIVPHIKYQYRSALILTIPYAIVDYGVDGLS